MTETVASLDVRLNDQASAGANAATAALEKLGQAGEKVEQSNIRVGRSTNTLVNRLDEVTRASGKLKAALAEQTQVQQAFERAQAKSAANLDALSRAVKQADTNVDKARANLKAAEAAAVGGGSAFDKLGGNVQNAALQFQDLAVQVASGQSAVTALAQQLPQLLSRFGTAGAVAGFGVAVAAVVYQMVVGKSAIEKMADALEASAGGWSAAISEAEKYERVLKSQGDQYVTAQAAGERYRAGLRGEGENIVALTRYYDGLTGAMRSAEQARLDREGATTTGTRKTLNSSIGAAFSTLDVQTGSGFGAAGSGVLDTSAQVEKAARAYAAFRAEGNLTADSIGKLLEGLRDGANITGAWGESFRTARNALLDLLPDVTKFEEQLRRLGVQQGALSGTNGAQAALEAARGAAGEVGGNYQTRQRLTQQRQQLRDGLSNPDATAEDRAGFRSSLQQISIAEMSMTPATTEYLRGLKQAADLARVAEGAARDLAAADQAMDDAARAAGASHASAGEKAQARALVQKRLDEELVSAFVTQNRATVGEKAIAAAYAESYAAGREKEAQIKAEAEITKYKIATDEEYIEVLDLLTKRNISAAEGAAQRKAAMTIRDQTDNLALLQKEASLLGETAEVRERELAIYKARQQAEREGYSASDAESLAKLAAQITDTTRALERQKSVYSELESMATQAFDRIGSVITQAFADGSLKAIDFKNIGKAALSEVGQGLASLGVMNPIRNMMGVNGGNNATLFDVLGVLAGGSVSPATATPGAAAGDGKPGTDYAGAASNLYKLYDKLTSSSSGIFSAAHVWDTGSSWADGVLNTTVWGTTGTAAQTAATNSALTGMGTTMYGPATPGAVAASMPSGATVGSLGAGALGVAGGAFAAYQGLQRGGVGGYTQAAGGAATAGLSAAAMAGAAIPVYGWVAAAAALIIGALLPGQKPSDRTGVYRVNTVTGAESADGLNGDRFSQENRDSAKGIADSVKTLGEQIGSLAGLPGAVANNFEVMVGGRDGVKYMANGKTEKFGTDDDAAQKLAEFATRDLLEKAARQTTDSNVRQVIGAKGTADPTATLEALEWYQSVYKAMAAPIEEAARATSTFETSIKALKDPYEAAITKARELGLAVEPLITRMDSDIAKAYAARDAKVDETKQSWADRLYTANGGPETIDRTLEAFDRAATAERASTEDALRDLGVFGDQLTALLGTLNDTLIAERTAVVNAWNAAVTQVNGGFQDRIFVATNDTSTVDGALAAYDRQAIKERAEYVKQGLGDINLLEQAQGAERAQIVKQFTDQANDKMRAFGGTVRNYLDNLNATPAGSRSADEQFQSASLFFERDLALARGGDEDAQGRLTNAADNLLQAASGMFASSEQFGAVRDYVEAALSNLPEVAAYDQQMVELLKAQGDTDLAAKLVLDQIAQRAGGAEGAGIIKAALEAGYGATVAALQASDGTWEITQDRLTTALAANDNSNTGQVVAWLTNIYNATQWLGSILESCATGIHGTNGSAYAAYLAAERGATVARDVFNHLAGGTDAILWQVVGAVNNVAAVVDRGFHPTITVNVQGGVSYGGPNDQGGQAQGSADGGYALGGVFAGGNVLPFATGGVVNSPRTFPMANGATGLMGEAGPEAIMPLGRDGLGRLGVRTTGAAGGDSAGLREEVRTLRAAVEALTALVARQHQQAQRAREAIADATERTAEGTEANADTSQLNRMRARA